MYYLNILFMLLLFPLTDFRSEANTPEISQGMMYFPPTDHSNWDTVSVSGLGWNKSAIPPLLKYLQEKGTRSFLILVNGKIAMEKYFGDQSAADNWEWNSAGKTLVSETVGIAQEEGLLNINDKVSKYLGQGWSREPLNKEKLITIRNLLTMTSGLNDKKQFVSRANLTYLADAGTRWSYSNVFQLLMKVIESASHEDFNTFYSTRIKNKIGMDGYWKNGLIFKIYHSTARSMARFGLLALNRGKWMNDQIIPSSYFDESIQTTQSLNPSYGYFWWLNGKNNYRLPGGQQVYNGPLVPDAPPDMYAAMGAADQRIYVIPSLKMVIVRMGNSSNPKHRSFAASGFDNALWKKINAVIK